MKVQKALPRFASNTPGRVDKVRDDVDYHIAGSPDNVMNSIGCRELQALESSARVRLGRCTEKPTVKAS
jgi:hypothetical protein